MKESMKISFAMKRSVTVTDEGFLQEESCVVR